MKYLLILLTLFFSTNQLFSIYAVDNIFTDAVVEEDTPVLPEDAYYTIIDTKYWPNGQLHWQIAGHLFDIGEGKYAFWINKNRYLVFKPQLKKNEYTGETIPFNLEEFAKNPDFSDCELLDFIWEDQDDEEKGVKKLYGINGVIVAFENEMAFSFILNPQKKFIIKDGERIRTLIKGNVNYYAGHYDPNVEWFVRPYDIKMVYDCPLNQVSKDQVPLVWHPETRTIDDSFGSSYVLDSSYNPKEFIISVLQDDNPSESRKFSIIAGEAVPISYAEDENVITLNYRDGDYCKFSKLKDYELFECILHFPFGILKASPKSDGSGINKWIECTGKVSSGNNFYGSTYDYNGFTANLNSLKLYLNSDSSDYIHNKLKFDDSKELQRWLFNADSSHWTLTATGEKTVWEDGHLVTESLKEKKKQDELARNEKIRKDVIASYKAKYGATTIDNIMNGRISVGMPWTLVGSVFPNGLSDASSYSKTYKVVNNTPYVNIDSKKIDKREHGWGILVYVTVRNGKVSNVRYTNHR